MNNKLEEFATYLIFEPLNVDWDFGDPDHCGIGEFRILHDLTKEEHPLMIDVMREMAKFFDIPFEDIRYLFLWSDELKDFDNIDFFSIFDGCANSDKITPQHVGWKIIDYITQKNIH